MRKERIEGIRVGAPESPNPPSPFSRISLSLSHMLKSPELCRTVWQRMSSTQLGSSEGLQGAK